MSAELLTSYNLWTFIYASINENELSYSPPEFKSTFIISNYLFYKAELNCYLVIFDSDKNFNLLQDEIYESQRKKIESGDYNDSNCIIDAIDFDKWSGIGHDDDELVKLIRKFILYRITNVQDTIKFDITNILTTSNLAYIYNKYKSIKLLVSSNNITLASN